VADHLYGARARIHTGGFEDFAEPDGAFDLVVGNVPFGKISPYDPRHNRGGATLHNYFIIKSLALTRPGGLVLALTSRYTLDSRNPAPRREMTRLADLVGAVRLPERAFAAAAGTDVVADLLILHRRQPGTPPLDTAWVGTEPLDPPPGLSPETLEALAAEPLAINQYLARRPDQILGHLAVDRGMYRQHELTVKPDGALGPRLTETLDRLVHDAVAQGATFSPAPARSRTTAAGAVTGDFDLRHAQEGSLVAARGGVVGRYVGGQVVAYRPRNSKDLWELRRLIGLRDAAREVLAVQLRGGTSDELIAAQHQLTDRYQDYKRLYGPLNRFRMVRTGRSDPDTGAAATRRDLPRMGGFRALDPDWALVAALEVFDDDTQTATPAPIFTQQVVAPPVRRCTVDSPADAVAVCLDESGTVTTERVAELLQIPEDQARGQLDGLVFADPATGDLVPSARYLSGNIRHKLAAARTAAERDSRWAANVAALEEVLPAQLEPGEITARLGAPWIPAHDIEAFCLEVLDAEVDIEYLADLGRWDLGLRMGSRRSVAMSSQWGTQRASAIDLLDASLNQRLYTVYDPVEDSNRRVRNDAETLAARDKQEVLGDRFGAWV
jgi:N12 class adenine-specific DNA methylase